MSRKQLRKLVQRVSGLMVLSGLIAILGAAGSSDLNLIDFNALLVRGGIGVILLLIGYSGLKVTNWKHIA